MINAQAQAILLLNSHFSKAADSKDNPLSSKEWGRFAMWLKDKQMSPETLLEGSVSQKLAGWTDSRITVERIQALVDRGSALALAMEKWTRAGLWVMTRSDPDYPKILKKRLANDAPPVFFGCGSRQLLCKGGIAVIGSRNASEGDLACSTILGQLAANQGYSIVSGGARGVDEAAMLGTLEEEGAAIGVLANDLLRAATSSKYRRYLSDNNLVLVSPYYPEAGFNAGNAMQRNKYIYCLADAAIAVYAGTRGGTWEGVLENIKNDWVPIWIKPTEDNSAGNATLVKKGASWLPVLDLSALIKYPKKIAVTPDEDLFPSFRVSESGAKPAVPTEVPSEVSEDQKAHKDEDGQGSNGKEEVQTVSKPKSVLYDCFLSIVEEYTSEGTKTVDDLKEIPGLHDLQPGQLNKWLKRAVEEGKLTKCIRPVCYQWKPSGQGEIFQEK